MRTVVLVGTAHKFQLPSHGSCVEGIDKFRHAVRELCNRHNVLAISEEMSVGALQENGVSESVAQQICADFHLCHQFSDPTLEERWKLGIRQDNDIRASHFFDKWTNEQIEADVLARGSAASDPIREKYWLHRIQELDKWPALFICGANHFIAFKALLIDAGIEVIEGYRDWEPT